MEGVGVWYGSILHRLGRLRNHPLFPRRHRIDGSRGRAVRCEGRFGWPESLAYIQFRRGGALSRPCLKVPSGSLGLPSARA
jgi:hypothetical protein